MIHLSFFVQYAADVRTVLKRLQDIEESIDFINKEEALYQWEKTSYPEVEVIKESIEPYQKLFNLVLKWQRTRKKFVETFYFSFFFFFFSQKSLFILQRMIFCPVDGWTALSWI